MNKLAHELNAALQDTAAGRLLSRIGREMFFPKGIVAQTAEANARASRFNATVGMAVAEGEPMMLSAVRDLMPSLASREIVAYAPTPGVADLRDIWKEEMVRKNPGMANLATTRPLVTGGLTNGLFHLAELFVDPGDVLILPELFWGNYRLMFDTRNGARIVTFPLFTDGGGFNVAGLAGALRDHSKAIVLLNFPNNPTGYSPTVDEAYRIVDVLAGHADDGNDILAICDDAYFGLFYESGLCEESLFGSLGQSHERIVAAKVDGATKEDFAWGFRIGFVTLAGKGLDTAALDALERKLMGNIRATVSNSSRIAQSLLTAMHRSGSFLSEKAEKRAVLKGRYLRVKDIVGAASDRILRPLPFNSGYFMAFECTGVNAGTGVNAEDLRLALLERGIGTIALGERYLRVAYST
ncbi:MAG: aminotransferase class I/II-fold pyridoxal phosphate-dependent enzyme, partial [Spirochaetia bacterium]